MDFLNFISSCCNNFTVTTCYENFLLWQLLKYHLSALTIFYLCADAFRENALRLFILSILVFSAKRCCAVRCTELCDFHVFFLLHFFSCSKKVEVFFFIFIAVLWVVFVFTLLFIRFISWREINQNQRHV